MAQETTRPETGGLGRGSTDGPASAEALIDALGMAHSTFTLYEHPASVEAFGRAVDTLGRAPFYPWRAEVGVDGFAVDGELVAVRREGSLRLSRGLFSMGIAAVDLVSPPSGDDLLALLQLLGGAQLPEDAREALEAAGVRAIRLLDRAMLLGSDAEATEDDDRPPTTDSLADSSPADFILGMMEEGDHAPRTVANRFVGEYERAHLLLDLDDAWGTEEIVHAFVDGFWYLPEAHRAEIFSLMLERGSRPENIAFLDQFGGTELAQMNRMFGSSGHPLLSEYLRVAAQEGGRHGDLVDLVIGNHSQSLTSRIVDQVASVLRARSAGGATRSETAIERLATAQPSEAETRRSVGNVLRGLLALADEAGTIEPTSRVWAERVAAALATGDLQAADDWINAAAGLHLDDRSKAALVTSLAVAATGPATDAIARLLTDPTSQGPGSSVRRAAPLFAAEGLIAELGGEGKAGRRKSLLTALQIVARQRPEGLLPHLTDPRWFVVRNVAIALGTSRRADMAVHLEPVASHPDYRVRIEALRALHLLKGEGSADLLLGRLGDTHEAVADEAGRLLGGLQAPGIDRRLVEQTASADPDRAVAAIRALGWRTTGEARATLSRVARKRLAWGTARRLRTAARRAMEGAR
ncbi:MAG: HEAT repeat domain-containing protein [Actinobacteria bacterium]|nr:HEAT repeat domain-containing protein [Actinomycetota bacterium]